MTISAEEIKKNLLGAGAPEHGGDNINNSVIRHHQLNFDLCDVKYCGSNGEKADERTRNKELAEARESNESKG